MRNRFSIQLLIIVMSLIICQTVYADAKSPDGLMVELLTGPAVSGITDPTPEFSWILHSSSKNDSQKAYRILVSADLKSLARDSADMWDSGVVNSANSINVSYAGNPIQSNQFYYWKVKTWCKTGGQSEWSHPMMFKPADISGTYATTRYPLVQTEVDPVSVVKKGDCRYLIDFGKVAFGFLRLDPGDLKSDCEIEVHFGERGNAEGIITDLGRTTVRYYKVTQTLKKGSGKLDIHTPKDGRNTGARAIHLPPEFGIVAPFRYIELVNFPGKLTKDMIKQIAVHYPFNEGAASFNSSDQVLNDTWALCKYSMKATSFCGVYIDGDRERIPYEADAYINQLSHYGVDREYTLARYSHEYLLENPTWPTEWKQHSVLMAYADWIYTGNTESLAANYKILKTQKTLEFFAGKDGLLKTDWRRRKDKPDRDIVDWPPSERDGYAFTEINTVVNAFHYKTLVQMSEIALALGKFDDSKEYVKKASDFKDVFNRTLFDKKQGLYVDGVGTGHTSLHANMFPLAFGLVPKDRQKKVADFVVSKGMACSVYGAQYLMEGLYEAGRDDAAMKLLTSKDIRSWYNMLRVGSTITLEAWDNKFKPNQDWNHAWGAVPGNIIPRYLMGVRPIEPGFAKVLIQPQPALLKNATAAIPTIRGTVTVSFDNKSNGPFTLKVDIPANMIARIGLPTGNSQSKTITVDGTKVEAKLKDEYLFIDEIGSGTHTLIRQ
ncbi:MAG: family 78 glycoside hydrolase catalytic domain [Phycisphaerae bacterium]|nr:family 78 glycoside hydrolase catalytic domain [Phycisphaerae bacterium]